MAAPTVDNNATGGGGATGSSTFSLATTQNNAVIVASIFIENNGGAAPAVTGITGGGLTFAQRAEAITPTGGRTELWWAPAPTALGSTTFTVALASSTDALAIVAFGVLGCHNINSPWDSNVSLAATQGHGNTSWTPTLTGVSTSQANDLLIHVTGADANFAAGATAPSGFSFINKTAQGHFEFCDIATAALGVTSQQSNQTFTYGSSLTPDHSGQVILDALTADVSALPNGPMIRMVG